MRSRRGWARIEVYRSAAAVSIVTKLTVDTEGPKLAAHCLCNQHARHRLSETCDQQHATRCGRSRVDATHDRLDGEAGLSRSTLRAPSCARKHFISRHRCKLRRFEASLSKPQRYRRARLPIHKCRLRKPHFSVLRPRSVATDSGCDRGPFCAPSEMPSHITFRFPPGLRSGKLLLDPRCEPTKTSRGKRTSANMAE